MFIYLSNSHGEICRSTCTTGYGINGGIRHDRVTKTGRGYGTEVNMVDKKQMKNVEYFNYLGSVLRNDKRSTCEIKLIAMAKAAFKKK
jgi:predicted TIM-barrel enzyme